MESILATSYETSTGKGGQKSQQSYHGVKNTRGAHDYHPKKRRITPRYGELCPCGRFERHEPQPKTQKTGHKGTPDDDEPWNSPKDGPQTSNPRPRITQKQALGRADEGAQQDHAPEAPQSEEPRPGS